MLSIDHVTPVRRHARLARLARLAMIAAPLALAAGCGSNALPGEPGADQPTSTEQELLTGATAFGFAYVHSNRVVATRSYNEHVVSGGSVLGSNTVTRTGLGAYTVTMSGLASPGGNAQVVAEGSNANRCRLVNWLSAGADETIAVQCNAPGGAPADTDFDVMFYVSSGTPTSSSYTESAYAYFSPSGFMPSGGYNYNSATAGATPNTVAVAGTGAYNVTLPKVHYQNASVQVSAYGGVGAPYCKISGWYPSGTDTVVAVRCFDTNGNPSANGFSLSYATSGPTIGEEGGHAWVSGGSMSASYAGVTGPIQGCSGSIALNPSGNGITVSGLSVWHANEAMAQVGFTTAYGYDSNYCKLSSLVNMSTSVTANVQCYTAAGVPTTSPFTVMTTSNQPSGPC